MSNAERSRAFREVRKSKKSQIIKKVLVLCHGLVHGELKFSEEVKVDYVDKDEKTKPTIKMDLSKQKEWKILQSKTYHEVFLLYSPWSLLFLDKGSARFMFWNEVHRVLKDIGRFYIIPWERCDSSPLDRYTMMGGSEKRAMEVLSIANMMEARWDEDGNWLTFGRFMDERIGHLFKSDTGKSAARVFMEVRAKLSVGWLSLHGLSENHIGVFSKVGVDIASSVEQQ